MSLSTNPLRTVIRALSYIACVWVSNKYAGGYWVVGPAFGLTVAVFDAKSLKASLGKHVFFIALSTLIYAFVYRISLLKIGDDTVLFNYFIGSFPIAIVTGSVLLPLLHMRVFNKSRAGLSRAILSLVGSFYIVELVMLANEKFQISANFPWLALLIAVWQGVYLYVFFSEKVTGLGK